MSTYRGTGVPRDNHLRGEATTYYGIVPAAALDPEASDLRADSVPNKRIRKSRVATRWASLKQHGDQDPTTGSENRHILIRSRGPKKCRIRARKDSDVNLEIHQSTCLRLDNTSDSELWILPDFEEWEMDPEATEQASGMQNMVEWAPLIARAVSSNLERLRRRLEGDGWDFVGGKYGQDEEIREDGSASEGSVDEEFDVVVLEVA